MSSIFILQTVTVVMLLFPQNKERCNCLHLICSGELREAHRLDMLRFTLEAGLYGMDISHILEEKNNDGNTALHLAATAGLRDCVEVSGVGGHGTSLSMCLCH